MDVKLVGTESSHWTSIGAPPPVGDIQEKVGLYERPDI